MQVLEVPTQINFSPLSRRYTPDEFWALPEREDHARYELIGGYLFMVPRSRLNRHFNSHEPATSRCP